MVDIGKVVDNFYNVCFAAQSACPLYDAEVDTSPGSIRAKVDALAANLTAKPAIISSTGAVPSILKGSSVRSLFLGPLYAPLGPTFPMLASTLAAAIAGNYTPLAIALQIPAAGLCADAASHPAKYTWQPEAGTAVRCGDGGDVRNTTNDEWRATLDAVQGVGARLVGGLLDGRAAAVPRVAGAAALALRRAVWLSGGGPERAERGPAVGAGAVPRKSA